MSSSLVALAQVDTHLGDVDTNLRKHIQLIKEAQSKNAKLVVFPELSLTGYVLQDLVSSVAISGSPDDPIFQELLDRSKEIDIVFGFVEADRRGRNFIASAYLSQGKILHIHRKVYLPTYGLFDEGRFFAPGGEVRAFDTSFGRVGMLICEDFWHISPPYLLWLDGADTLILISASPGRGLREEDRLESAAWVERINQAYASVFTCHVLHTNRVGFEDGLHFWGGATAFDPNGVMTAKGPYHEEALLIAEIDPDHLRRTRSRLPLLRDERPELTWRELGRILTE